MDVRACHREGCDRCPNCLTLACLSRLQKVANHPCLLQVCGTDRQTWVASHQATTTTGNRAQNGLTDLSKQNSTTPPSRGAPPPPTATSPWRRTRSVSRRLKSLFHRCVDGVDALVTLFLIHQPRNSHLPPLTPPKGVQQGLCAAGLREARGATRRAGAQGCVLF